MCGHSLEVNSVVKRETTYTDYGVLPAAHHDGPVNRGHHPVGGPPHEHEHFGVRVHLEGWVLQSHRQREDQADCEQIKLLPFLQKTPI